MEEKEDTKIPWKKIIIGLCLLGLVGVIYILYKRYKSSDSVNSSDINNIKLELANMKEAQENLAKEISTLPAMKGRLNKLEDQVTYIKSQKSIIPPPSSTFYEPKLLQLSKPKIEDTEVISNKEVDES